MSIRLAKIFDGHSRHQKILQHSVFDHFHPLRRFALIVKVIRAGQLHSRYLVRCRVVHHAQEFRQHFLPDLLRERLSFLFIALSVAFQSVTQHFMKKNRSRAPAQYRRSIIWLRHGRLAQRAQVRGHFLDLARQFRFARQTARRGGLKCFYSQQVHAVLGARLRFHDQASRSAGRHDRASLARNHPGIRALHLNHDRCEVHLRVSPERARESLDLTFPGRAVERHSRVRFPDVRLRLLLREIRRLVFFFGANRRVRAHVQQ